MIRLFSKFFDIREGEWLRVALMFSYLFLIIASLLIVKPVRNSMFLTAFGPESLPYAFMLVAVAAGLFTALYGRYSERLRLYTLISYTLFAAMASLLFFWFMLKSNIRGSVFVYVFYIWVAIFGTLATSQFWLLAQDIFDARQARRLFGILGAGGIAGGIAGGYLTNFLAPMLGTNSMILCGAGVLACCAGLLAAIARSEAGAGRQTKTRRQAGRAMAGASVARQWRLVSRTPHLRNIALLVGVGVLVANLVDYQFNAIAAENIATEDGLTAFFGLWLSNLSIASLLIQLIVTPRILKRFGVGPALFFLPIGILGGSIVILVMPVLWAGILIKVSEGGFKQSMHKSGMELLSLPIPKDLKNRTKAFIDVFVDSFATGVGGLLLILLTFFASFSAQQVSIAVIVLVAAWLYLNVRTRKSYVNSFREAIETRSIDVDDIYSHIREDAVLETLTTALAGNNDRQILFALSILENARNSALEPHFVRLTSHGSSEIRWRAVRLLRRHEIFSERSRVEPLIGDGDLEVRVQAIRYLTNADSLPAQRLRKFLEHPDVAIQTAALVCAARESREKREVRESLDLPELYERILGSRYANSTSRAEAIRLKVLGARVIGIAPGTELHGQLDTLLWDSSIDVLNAAAVSAGQLRAPEFLPALIAHLETRHLRQVSRQAIAGYSDAAFDLLIAHFRAENASQLLRIEICRVMAQMRTQKAVDFLLDCLDESHLQIRFEALKSLSKLKTAEAQLRFDRRKVETRIQEETNSYYVLRDHLRRHAAAAGNGENGMESAARKLLIRALGERLDINVERIFRLLGLRYAPRDMYNAYRGLVSGNLESRANAIEFLDNLLATRLKERVIPLIESDQARPQQSGANPASPAVAADTGALLATEDNWLRVCAAFLIAQSPGPEGTDLLQDLAHHDDAVLRETAEYALRRVQPQG